MPMKKNLVTEYLKINQQKEILYQDIEDELVILNIKEENYFGLDKVGTSLWNILLNSSSIKHAYDQMLEEYDVEPEILKNDLSNFINELEKNGLVRISTIE